MTHRVYCFNPGPAALPQTVLEEVQAELLDYRGTGMSVMELSHRSPEYAAIHADTKALFKSLLGLDDNWSVLFMTGGSSTQFFALPYNVLNEGRKRADYICTGTWSRKAIEEARRFGNIRVVHDAVGEDGVYRYVPSRSQLDLSDDAVYLHITSNNTIAGTQYHTFPRPPEGTFLAADMCSDMLWRKFDPSPFGIFYASAQKNLGPAGVTVVAIHHTCLERCSTDPPTILQYKTMVKKDSLFNTAPCFAIYVMNRVLHWLDDNGGLDAAERRNREKASILYQTLDAEPDFWITTVEKSSRSVMNVVWRIRNDESLEARFVEEAKRNGLVGLKGHRSVGGIRASLYNAMSMEGVKALVDFMAFFLRTYG